MAGDDGAPDRAALPGPSGAPPPRPVIAIPSLASSRRPPSAPLVAPGRVLDPAAAAMLGRPPPPAPLPRPPPDVGSGTGVFAADGGATAFAAPPPPPPPATTSSFPPPTVVLAGGGGGGSFAGPPPGALPPQRPPPRAGPPAGAADAGSPTLTALFRQHPHAILVAPRQDGNPILTHLRSTRWAFADVAPDYVLTEDAAAMFLSLRFHLLHGAYVTTRVAALARWPRLKVLLCHVDVDDPAPPLKEVNVIALRAGVTLLCAFSAPEAARYLELLRAFAAARTPADAIAGRVGDDYASRLGAVLTTVRGVTRADVAALGAAFGSLRAILAAPRAAVAATPGIGPTKAARLATALSEPFFGGGGGGGGGARQVRIDQWAKPAPSSSPAGTDPSDDDGDGDDAGAQPAAWASAAAVAAELEEGGVDGGGGDDDGGGGDEFFLV